MINTKMSLEPDYGDTITAAELAEFLRNLPAANLTRVTLWHASVRAVEYDSQQGTVEIR